MNTKPDKEGWYWYEGKERSLDLVYVYASVYGKWVYCGFDRGGLSGVKGDLEQLKGQFNGPLVKPLMLAG